MAFFKGDDRALRDHHNGWCAGEGMKKERGMREIGRGGESRYLGVCLDGYGRRCVDHEHVSSHADAKTRKMGGWTVS